MEYTDYKNRVAPDRYREVWISCEICGTERWVRWVRVKKGQGRFCGRTCAKNFQRSEGMKTRNKESAIYYYDEKSNIASACWREPDGSQKRTTYAHWLWEMNYGSVPEGHICRWKDGSPKNATIENVELISPEQNGAEISKRLMGHTFSDETKKKMSDAKNGIKLSEEHKSKISDSLYRRWASGEFDSIHVGEHNKHWRGGVETTYPKEFNMTLRKAVKGRDNYKCRVCGNRKTRMEVHHMDGDRHNNAMENLILLCYECHHKIHDGCDNSDPVILAFRSQLHY